MLFKGIVYFSFKNIEILSNLQNSSKNSIKNSHHSILPGIHPCFGQCPSSTLGSKKNPVQSHGHLQLSRNFSLLQGGTVPQVAMTFMTSTSVFFFPIKYVILLFQFTAVIILMVVKVISNRDGCWPTSRFIVKF